MPFTGSICNEGWVVKAYISMSEEEIKLVTQEINNHPEGFPKKELLESLIRNYTHVAVPNENLLNEYILMYKKDCPEWGLWNLLKDIYLHDNDIHQGTFHMQSKRELSRLFIELLEKETGKEVTTSQEMYSSVVIDYV